MLLNVRVTAFKVFELLKESQWGCGGGAKITPFPQYRVKDFFNKCKQTRKKLQTWLYLIRFKNILNEDFFVFGTVK